MTIEVRSCLTGGDVARGVIIGIGGSKEAGTCGVGVEGARARSDATAGFVSRQS